MVGRKEWQGTDCSLSPESHQLSTSGAKPTSPYLSFYIYDMSTAKKWNVCRKNMICIFVQPPEGLTCTSSSPGVISVGLVVFFISTSGRRISLGWSSMKSIDNWAIRSKACWLHIFNWPRRRHNLIEQVGERTMDDTTDCHQPTLPRALDKAHEGIKVWSPLAKTRRIDHKAREFDGRFIFKGYCPLGPIV